MEQDFLSILNELGLTQADAAKFLSVDVRTIRRWVEDSSEITGPAKQALLAWQRLHRLYVPWRPEGIDIIKSHEKISQSNRIVSRTSNPA